MRLILFDCLTESRTNFYPLALSRPIWELRCGMTSIGEKLIDKTAATDVAFFVPPYMADVYREQTDCPVNDATAFAGDDLLLVNARVKAEDFNVETTGPSQAAFNSDGECLFARVNQNDLARLNCDSIDAILHSVREVLPQSETIPAT